MTHLPIVAAENTSDWFAANAGAIESAIHDHGAVLLRGLGVGTADEVAAVADALGVKRMTEREGFAPRGTYSEAVYSSSGWPQDEPMCMHHELSYADEVPSRIVFGCLTAPKTGGGTELADAAEMLEMLPADLVERFATEGWLLIRTYHEVGVSWQDAFGTDDPSEVDKYCAGAHVWREWQADGRLLTRQRRAAVVPHPRRDVPVWFNQIAFLNEWTMDPVIREFLVDSYGPQGLPFNTAHGDGTPVTAEAVEAINAAYAKVTVVEPWQDGDVLLVDNIRMAHSRAPYTGDREVVVILGDPVRPAGHVLP